MDTEEYKVDGEQITKLPIGMFETMARRLN